MNNDLPVSLLIAAFAGALMLVLPHLSPLRYYFAIIVPAGFRETPAARASLRRYNSAVICGVVIAVVAVLQLSRLTPELLPIWAMLIPSVMGGMAFLWERSQLAKIAPRPDTVREADLMADDDHLPRWIAWILPPFAFPLAAAAYLRAHWDDLPARIPLHWNAHNQADRWADKTPVAVYGQLVFASGMMLLMVLMTLAVFYGSRRGRQRTAIVQMMIAAGYFLALLSGGMALLPALHISPATIVIPAILFPALFLVRVFKVLRDPKMPVENTPDDCWYLGSLYVNRNDPAIFVQRRIGFGYTLNMGNRLAWLLMGGFAAALIGLMFTLPR